MHPTNPYSDYWNAGFENGRRIAQLYTKYDDIQRELQEAILIAVTMYYPIQTFYEGLIAGVRSINPNFQKDTDNEN